MDFPNLPYLIDGDLKLTESFAIVNYVPIRFKHPQLLGGNEFDRILAFQVYGVLGDIENEMFLLTQVKPEDYEAKKVETYKKVQLKLGYLEKFLGSKDFFLGYVTYADFFLLLVWETIKAIDEKLVEGYKGLSALSDRVANLEKIKAYRASERFRKKVF